MVDGKGDPNNPNSEYQSALELLYAVTYTIKMSKMGGKTPKGYFEYVVPPLEGLWWMADGGPFDFIHKDFCWISMIRQPEFVTAEVFEAARAETAKKKPALDVSKIRLASFEEGLCVQCMHLGPYGEERRTKEKMDAFAAENNLLIDFSDTRRHHEIYLGDPRKTAPEKLKTVLRHPVREG
jgi:hypothetical protein